MATTSPQCCITAAIAGFIVLFLHLGVCFSKHSVCCIFMVATLYIGEKKKKKKKQRDFSIPNLLRFLTRKDIEFYQMQNLMKHRDFTIVDNSE